MTNINISGRHLIIRNIIHFINCLSVCVRNFNVKHLIGKTMKKEKTTMIKEDELKQIYGGCIEEPSLKTGPLTMEDILDPFLNGFKIH